jgi:hypothetical protein
LTAGSHFQKKSENLDENEQVKLEMDRTFKHAMCNWVELCFEAGQQGGVVSLQRRENSSPALSLNQLIDYPGQSICKHEAATHCSSELWDLVRMV